MPIDLGQFKKKEVSKISKKAIKIEKAPVLIKHISKEIIVPKSNFVGYEKLDKEYNPPVEAYMSAYYNLTGSTFRAKKPVKINTLKEIQKIMPKLIEKEKNR